MIDAQWNLQVGAAVPSGPRATALQPPSPTNQLFPIRLIRPIPFEFELLAPPDWIAATEKQFHLRRGDHSPELAARRDRARPWYAPKEIQTYDHYRDLTSVEAVSQITGEWISRDFGRMRGATREQPLFAKRWSLVGQLNRGGLGKPIRSDL